MHFTASQWAEFISAVKAGKYDNVGEGIGGPCAADHTPSGPRPRISSSLDSPLPGTDRTQLPDVA